MCNNRPDNFSKKFKGFLTLNYTTFSLKWATVDETHVFKQKKNCERLSTIFDSHTVHNTYATKNEILYPTFLCLLPLELCYRVLPLSLATVCYSFLREVVFIYFRAHDEEYPG